MPIPFNSTFCATCLQLKEWDFILLNLNAALQRTSSHHCGVGELYCSTTCGKTYKVKHAAQCQVPKCKGARYGEGKTAICGICNEAFKNQKGLSQHERLIHLVKRSENRERAATEKASWGSNKGYSKMRQKEFL